MRCLALLTLTAACGSATIVRTACDACGGDCVDEVVPNRGYRHVDGPVDYVDSPPTSGSHDACWAPWGVHDSLMPPERWVHNLEHGGVVFLYGCEDCADDVATLTTLTQSLPQGRALLTRYDGAMEHTFAAVSWDHRRVLGCADPDALTAFFDDHVAQAREDLTAGPSCDPSNTFDPPDTDE